jgi:hypothetical protein
MSGFREALDAGREAVRERLAEGKYYDPAGQGHNEARLRGMGKWRFILIRGIVRFAPPMFLFLVLSNLSKDIHTAQAFHQLTLRYLLGHWIVGLGLNVSLGFVVGFLAWRRLVSDVWPSAKPDQESCITILGPLSRP